ncbi:porin [Sphingomonas sp. GCM10030256]|uniref:porin n=1 Tax=Sphingomonas sp. GCM10030256 TaxID=3273427 RepID=UPI003624096A
MIGVSSGVIRVAAVGAAVAILLPATFALAAPAVKKRPPAVALSFEQGFTPAQADPRLAAAFANRPVLASDFKFTPTASKRRPSQIRVAIRARAETPGQAVERVRDVAAQTAAAGVSLTPATYNLGVAVGWKRFAISGDVATAKSSNPALGQREAAVLGLSYDLKRFTGRVAASADHAERDVPALGESKAYALDVGGAYNISNRVAVTGGVRYKIERDRVATLNDQRRDSQAVYVGTALKF